MSDETGSAARRALLQEALARLDELQGKLAASERSRREPIAIVGLGCRFPAGGNDPAAFWQVLRDGVDGVSEVPPERWSLDEFYDPDPDAPGKTYTRFSAFLDHMPDRFDAAFFGISPREASGMDPQHRLLLEVAWESLENAGIAPTDLAGTDASVFLGIASIDYAAMQGRIGGVEMLDTYHASGVAHAIAAGRISYTLGLQGPCLAVDTACSSAMVAIHLAVQNLRAGTTGLAIAGGINLVLGPEGAILTSRARMLSVDGHCKTFDAAADGYVRGEGCGLVVLKRLSDALAAGDDIRAVIRGSAINQDGRSAGLTAPHGPSQEAVIRAALEDAGVTPGEVSYVEAHGTGTSLGDPIEVKALGAVFGPSHSAAQPLIVGGSKSNIGHLEAAAGAAGLVKVLMMLQHGEVPPNLNFRNPNPLIPWAELPIRVPTQVLPWVRGAAPRIAGISAFGFSGTNSHMVIEEAPARPMAAAAAVRSAQDGAHPQLLTLSARDQTALRELAGRFAAAVQSDPAPSLADVCFTANTGRAQFAHRLAVSAATPADLAQRLAAFAAGQQAPSVVHGHAPPKKPRFAFLFTGQGSQYAGMGRGLYASQPAFREALDRCAAVLDEELGRPLLPLLFDDGAALNQTAFTQPALFALEYSLAAMWRSWGIEPGALVGHSVGEYVAACVASVFSLEDGLRLIAARGRLMQALPPGGTMLAVMSDEATVAAAIAAHAAAVSIAALNGPANTVISGAAGPVQEIAQALAARGIETKPLVVSHAFHSPLMEPMLDEFEKVAARVAYSAPRIVVIANATGAPAAGADLQSAGYWRRHVRDAVRFADSIDALRAQGYRQFLEIGPKPTLTGMARQCWPADGPAASWLPSLRTGREDAQQVMESLAAAYVQGASVDWTAVAGSEHGRRIALPTYPFQRTRYWFTLPPSRPRTEAGALHPLLTRRIRSAALADTVFETSLSAEWPAFLRDHLILENVIYPATGYIEMALAAARQLGAGLHALESFSIHAPLMLPERSQDAVTVQLVAAPAAGGATAFRILSAPGGDKDAPWTLHATGTLRSLDRAQAAPPAPAEWRAGTARAADEYYELLRERGATYGPAFRGIAQLTRGDGEAWARIELPAEAGEPGAYLLHPAALDAAFQVIGAALPPAIEAALGDAVFMPVDVRRLVALAPLPRQFQVYGTVVAAPGGETLSAELALFDTSGAPLALVQSVSLKRASRKALLAALQHGEQDWFYEQAWRPQALAAEAPAPAGSCLLLLDEGGLGEQVAELLEGSGVRCARVARGDDVAAALASAPRGTEPLRVVSLRSLDADTPLAASVAALDVVQALTTAGAPQARLFMVTRGAQPAAGGATSLAQAPVWGLGRVAAQEHPELHTVLFDLDPAAEPGDAASLAAELTAGSGESQVALRRGERLVARLVRSRSQRNAPLEPYRAEITSRGVLDNLVLRPLVRTALAPGEVEVEVQASALNFRDVLNVLGMYPGDPGAPGTECAGVVSAVGEGVSVLQPGDSVMGIAAHAFDSHALARAELLVRKPDGLTFAEAAGVPIAFLTALYGLQNLAGLKPGARVLIHAAAGGVGLAAVQIARKHGAEIFATAGSAEKHAYLKGLGVQHVMSSRTLDFADEVLALTGGAGVDIVLNSLADDFIPKSLSALAADGCFLEIGKRGIWSAEQVAAVRPNARYFPYDLSDVLSNDVPLWRAMLESVLADLESGALQPLPVTAFPAAAIVDAFRFMAQAKHIGKVVVSHRAIGPLVRSDAGYLVTGGLSGLGLETAAWLVAEGARHVALVGRSAPGAAAQESLAQMRAAGANVHVFAADISSAIEVARVFAEAAAAMPPLRGVVHSAGVLDDGTLRQQTAERFATVMATKVDGASHLDHETRGLPLDFFVMFSSVAAVFGAPGQGNYAAANAFMDALAHARRAAGRCALSINWGGWAEVGMAARLAARDHRQREQAGIDLITPERGMRAFAHALAGDAAQVAVLPIDWPAFRQRLGDAVPAFFAELTAQPAQAAQAPASERNLRQRLQAAAPEEVLALITAFVAEQVARVFGIDPGQPLDRQQPLADFGLDSLMSVELRNRLQAGSGKSLPTTLAFDHPTIDALAAFLAASLREEAPPASVPPAAAIEQQVEKLSDDEVSAMLSKLMAAREE